MPTPHPSPAPNHVLSASRAEHTDLALRLYRAAQPLAEAVEAGDCYQEARETMAGFLLTQLVSHLTQEEEGVLRAASEYPDTRLLVDALRAEQRAMAARIKDVMDAPSGWEAVAGVRAIHALLAVHSLHIDEVLLPAMGRQGHRECD